MKRPTALLMPQWMKTQKNTKQFCQFFMKFKMFQMQVKDCSNNYEAINGVINSLKDHKLENYKKTLNCFKRLGRFKCN